MRGYTKDSTMAIMTLVLLFPSVFLVVREWIGLGADASAEERRMRRGCLLLMMAILIVCTCIIAGA